VIDKSGFRFTVQKSNCLQANVYLKKDLFTRFECEGNHQLGINFLLLLDFLSMLGTNSGNQVALHCSNNKKIVVPRQFRPVRSFADRYI
jgi:hypothetical protein